MFFLDQCGIMNLPSQNRVSIHMVYFKLVIWLHDTAWLHATVRFFQSLNVRKLWCPDANHGAGRFTYITGPLNWGFYVGANIPAPWGTHLGWATMSSWRRALKRWPCCATPGAGRWYVVDVDLTTKGGARCAEQGAFFRHVGEDILYSPLGWWFGCHFLHFPIHIGNN